jgi:hypothetical protein
LRTHCAKCDFKKWCLALGTPPARIVNIVH